MIPIVVAILGFISVAIPPLARWLETKTGGYSVWKTEITFWATKPRSIRNQFFGRDAALKTIANSFKRRHVLVLSGGPGIGKSQLAAEFVQKSKRKGFGTPGGESPTQTLISLAPHLGIERGRRSEDEILVQTRRRLQALPNKALWVIDNLSNLDQLNTLLNETGNISILVTSQDGRDNIVPDVIDYQPVGALDPSSAVLLLCRSHRHDSEHPVLLEIVKEVGQLPRAVEALAVQLDSPWESPERLLEELRATPNLIELERFRTQTAGLQIPQSNSLFNALRGPVDALTDSIKETLGPLGYTADLPIPIPLVEALTGLTGGALIKFLEECSSKSVLSASKDQVTLHSLTAAVIASTTPIKSLQTALQYATSRLDAIVRTNNPVHAVEISHYEHILSWASLVFDQEDKVVGAFSNSLANAYDIAGRFEEAAKLHQENLNVMERVLGPDQPDTLKIRNNLAAAFGGAGRFEEAAKLHQENLVVMERVLGPEHPDTLVSRNNLGKAYNTAGRFEEATRLHQENLVVMERVLGPEHPTTLVSRSNLALAYDGAGHFEDGARLLQENLVVMERVFGPEHPTTVASRNNLAKIYRALGKYLDADALFEHN
jgi:tetratricopeptide (TPR) repeat protein